MSSFRLREVRESAAMSKVDLARKAGVTERTIRNLESGVYKPSMPTAIKLAEALGVSLDSFVTGEAAPR